MSTPSLPPDKEYLWQLFQYVDTDQSGYISPPELQAVLMYGSWEPFSIDTCRLLVRMFDKNNNWKVSFQDFCALWKYIMQWEKCFKQFDKDGSGAIGNYKLLTALQTLGFKLPLKTVDMIVKRYEQQGMEGGINFEDFIRCCVALQSITRGFKTFDPDVKGEIKIKFADLVEMVFGAGL